jgi:hypothetical protein
VSASWVHPGGGHLPAGLPYPPSIVPALRSCCTSKSAFYLRQDWLGVGGMAARWVWSSCIPVSILSSAAILFVLGCPSALVGSKWMWWPGLHACYSSIWWVFQRLWVGLCERGGVGVCCRLVLGGPLPSCVEFWPSIHHLLAHPRWNSVRSHLLLALLAILVRSVGLYRAAPSF